MPTPGLVTTHLQHEESLLTKNVHLFPTFTVIDKDFFVLLIVTLLDVMYCRFVQSLRRIQGKKNSYQDGNSPTIVHQSLILVLVLVLLWACYYRIQINVRSIFLVVFGPHMIYIILIIKVNIIVPP